MPDMVFFTDSDASYLVEPSARSRAAGYHYLGDSTGQSFNAPIYALAKVIKSVMTSAMEAEVKALFMNAKKNSQIEGLVKKFFGVSYRVNL